MPLPGTEGDDRLRAGIKNVKREGNAGKGVRVCDGRSEAASQAGCN